MSDEQTPDLTHWIEGYRAWYVSKAGEICSITREDAWLPHQPNRALCLYEILGVRRAHGTIPHEHCTCGIYAMKQSHHVLPMTNAVFGRVALWGKVVVGRHGFRAQHAYPLSLSSYSLAKRYGVKWEPFACLSPFYFLSLFLTLGTFLWNLLSPVLTSMDIRNVIEASAFWFATTVSGVATYVVWRR